MIGHLESVRGPITEHPVYRRLVDLLVRRPLFVGGDAERDPWTDAPVLATTPAEDEAADLSIWGGLSLPSAYSQEIVLLRTDLIVAGPPDVADVVGIERMGGLDVPPEGDPMVVDDDSPLAGYGARRWLQKEEVRRRLRAEGVDALADWTPITNYEVPTLFLLDPGLARPKQPRRRGR